MLAGRVRQRLRRLKARSIRFEKRYPPIIILGLRRGGTTMVADAVADAPGVWFANEPFAMLPAHPAYALKRRLLPPAEHSHFFALEGAPLHAFSGYVERLLAARLPQLGTCRKTRFPLRADRVCLKVLNAPWMLEWFARETDARLLATIRHPAAQALSVLRQGWAFPSTAYLYRLDDIAGNFTAEQIETWQRIEASGSDWERAILDWIVESLPLRRAERAGVQLWKYEDIVARSEVFVDEVLIGQFGLEDRAELLCRLGRPSGSSGMSRADVNQSILSQDIPAITERWRKEIDDAMKRDARRLLDCFEVTHYTV